MPVATGNCGGGNATGVEPSPAVTAQRKNADGASLSSLSSFANAPLMAGRLGRGVQAISF